MTKRKPYKPLMERAIRDGQLKPFCLPTHIVKGPDQKWYIVPDLVQA